jgi:hypothetical protein
MEEGRIPWKDCGLLDIVEVSSRDTSVALGVQTILVLSLEEGLVAHSLAVTTHSKKAHQKLKEDHFPGGRPTSSPYEAA